MFFHLTGCRRINSLRASIDCDRKSDDAGDDHPYGDNGADGERLMKQYMIFFDDVGNKSIHEYLREEINRLCACRAYVTYDMPIKPWQRCQLYFTTFKKNCRLKNTGCIFKPKMAGGLQYVSNMDS